MLQEPQHSAIYGQGPIFGEVPQRDRKQAPGRKRKCKTLLWDTVGSPALQVAISEEDRQGSVWFRPKATITSKSPKTSTSQYSTVPRPTRAWWEMSFRGGCYEHKHCQVLSGSVLLVQGSKLSVRSWGSLMSPPTRAGHWPEQTILWQPP